MSALSIVYKYLKDVFLLPVRARRLDALFAPSRQSNSLSLTAMTGDENTSNASETLKKVTDILNILVLKEMSPHLLSGILPKIDISERETSDNLRLYIHNNHNNILNSRSVLLADIAKDCVFLPLDKSIELFTLAVMHDKGPQATLNYAKFIWELMIRADSASRLQLMKTLALDYLAREDTFKSQPHSQQRWQIMRACASATTLLINEGLRDEAYQATKKFITAFGEGWLACHPPLSAFAWHNKLSKKEEVGMMAEINASLTSAKHLEEFEQFLSNKRVAIVGNSSREIGRELGPKIDAHEVVIRFSTFNTLPPYDKDYGSKVDIVVNNAGCLHLLSSAKTKNLPEYLVTLQHSGSVFIVGKKNVQSVYGHLKSGIKLISLPISRWLMFMERNKGIIPSTGLMTITYVKSLNPLLSMDNIYGFSFQDKLADIQWDNTRYHYYNSQRHTVPHRHNALSEKKLANKILSGQWKNEKSISLSELSHCPKNTIVIIREFRLGDIIAIEPIITWIHKHYPDHQLAFAAHYNYIDAVSAHPCLTYLVPINNSAEIIAASRNFPEHIKTLFLDFLRPEWGELGNSLKKSNPRVHRLNYFFWDGLLGMISTQAGLPKLTSQPRFYIQNGVEVPFALPREYVVFHTSSQDQTKDWLPDKWLELAGYFFDKGLAVVELGWTKVMHINNPLFYDGTKLELHQTAKIIEGAKCFFGIDSGLAHLANALEVDGVCILGVLNRITRYTHYVPYTGKYSCGHIIRAKGARPAAEVTVDEVIHFYKTKNKLYVRLNDICKSFFISIFYNRFMRCNIIKRNQFLKNLLWTRKKHLGNG